MNNQAKADLEKLETLREQALCGPVEQREAARQAYEELRSTLFDFQSCELPGDQQETRELAEVATYTCEICGLPFVLTEDERRVIAGQDRENPKICTACRRARSDDAASGGG